MHRPSTLTLAVLAASLATAASQALAEEKPREQVTADLPGVRQPAPPPLPEPETPVEAAPGGAIRVGNWDIRVSGSVSYGVGFSSRD